MDSSQHDLMFANSQQFAQVNVQKIKQKKIQCLKGGLSSKVSVYIQYDLTV